MLRRLLLMLLLAPVLTLPAAAAAGRLALLIGNEKYGAGIPELRNPHRDIALLEGTLKQLGFEVTVLKDAGLRDMQRAVNGYVRKLQRSGDGAIGFFYYSGHGAQDEATRTNYLIPVDAPTADSEELWSASMKLDSITQVLQTDVPAATHFVVFDACRNSLRLAPAAGSRSLSDAKGFVPVATARGMLIAYATADGRTASDIGEGSGPYAKALAEEMLKPGVEAVTMFRRVQLRVQKEIKQEPWLSYGAVGEVYLAGADSGQGSGTAPAASAETATAGSSQIERDWAAVENSGSPSAIEGFIARHGSDLIYGPLARDKLLVVRRAGVKVAVQTKPPETVTAEPAECDGIRMEVKDSNKRCFKQGDSFSDCSSCPEMVVLPAGTFTMGSPPGEAGRTSDEGPLHEVTIGKPIAVGKFEVTRGLFAVFAEEIGLRTADGCYVLSGPGEKKLPNRSWLEPGFQQSDDDPVVCVSWDEASAYAKWLSKKTGQDYRLPSEAEWEYAARGESAPGTYPRFYFGADDKDLCAYANGADTSTSLDAHNQTCSDDIAESTATVGRYKPNAFGLYDTLGNVWEWTADCYHDSYSGAPADGAAWLSACGVDRYRVVRGGSWGNVPKHLRSANRDRDTRDRRSSSLGFRLARAISP